MFIVFVFFMMMIIVFRAIKYRSRLNFSESITNLELSLLRPQVTKSFDDDSYPLIIHQTYSNVNKIPPKVYENIKRFAPSHKHVVYDDFAALKFLKENFSKNNDIFKPKIQ
jgi:hypothetical protein